MTVFKRGDPKKNRWHYEFQIHGTRYRGAIKEARTKSDAEQAEIKLKSDVYDGRYTRTLSGSMKLSEFIDKVFLPWSRTNKRSWKVDEYNAPTLKTFFKGRQLREITPFMVEHFKRDLSKRRRRYGKQETDTLSPASVNRFLEMLSRCFTLAISLGKADYNPVSKVRKFRLDNERYRYLLPEEEPRLMASISDGAAHLRDLITVALSTGLRRSEQLNMRVDQVDFARGVIVAARTKTRRNREIPMAVLSAKVPEIIHKLCGGKKPDDYLFVNPATGRPFRDVKKGFHTACRRAGITGLTWHDLRATFGTRLAEAGYEAFTIMRLMGHSDMKTTQRYIRGTEVSRITRQERRKA